MKDTKLANKKLEKEYKQAYHQMLLNHKVEVLKEMEKEIKKDIQLFLKEKK